MGIHFSLQLQEGSCGEGLGLRLCIVAPEHCQVEGGYSKTQCNTPENLLQKKNLIEGSAR